MAKVPLIAAGVVGVLIVIGFAVTKAQEADRPPGWVQDAIAEQCGGDPDWSQPFEREVKGGGPSYDIVTYKILDTGGMPMYVDGTESPDGKASLTDISCP